MSEIDIQNSKQIRDPMQVLITMSLADDDITMSYSGYSSAKVADGVLDKRNWPMRGLADLQGDGFLLDGSCVLYDSTTQPSQANGKLGVRSNVGESVSVTATGSKVMASLTVVLTGAESVTYNGQTTQITGSSVTIPVLSTSISMTFAPASETERIEINNIYPDSEFRITNDNLIRATVSLRSDLSIIEPTLPESELNVEVYHPVDVSEDVASIPEDTGIIYQAGYEGDMSPARKFYVAGQVTWADNVLTIHAVDAVHFLEETQVYPVLVGRDHKYSSPNNATIRSYSRCVRGFLALTGVYFDVAGSLDRDYSTKCRLIIKSQTVRDLVCTTMQYFHLDEGRWITYVDAGIPTYYEEMPTAKWSIQENDCANITKDVDRTISNIIFNGTELTLLDNLSGTWYEVGSIDWIYNGGAFLHPDDYVSSYAPRYEDTPFSSTVKNGSALAFDAPEFLSDTDQSWGYKLMSPDLPQGWLDDWYTQVLPWTTSGNFNQRSVWQSKGLSTNDTQTAEMYGSKYITTDAQLDIAGVGGGDVVTMENPSLDGGIDSANSEGGVERSIYPYEALVLLSRRMAQNNVTGSFTWKGDPRYQPRDVVEWERLDGTTETITLENITLTHEGGGTSAEITYRKGVV